MFDFDYVFIGGFEFYGFWGMLVSKNLISYVDGFVVYSDAEIKTMVTTGKRPDGSAMTPPMPYGYYAATDAADIDAIILYLRSLAPLPDM